jgi:hypothetical protein
MIALERGLRFAANSRWYRLVVLEPWLDALDEVQADSIWILGLIQYV